MADDEKVSFVHIFISHGRFMQTRSLCLFHEVNFVSEFLSTRYMPFHWLNNCTLRFCGIISITITIIVNQNLKEIYLHFQTRINYDSYVQCTVIRNQYVALSRLQFYLIDKPSEANITDYTAFSKYRMQKPKPIGKLNMIEYTTHNLLIPFQWIHQFKSIFDVKMH